MRRASGWLDIQDCAVWKGHDKHRVSHFHNVYWGCKVHNMRDTVPVSVQGINASQNAVILDFW